LVDAVSHDAPVTPERGCPHCGGEHPPHRLKCTKTDMVLPLAGRMLDEKFRLMRQIGKGGMASVWLAVNTRVERLVAIKLIRPEVVRRTDTVKRFRSEARAAGRIGHPNICDILDFGDSTIGPYIVMEYLRGRSLAEWIRHEGRLPVGTVVHVAREALAGLAAAHREGIIHRDLKPENLFIHEPEDGEPVVKLMDFGVSKFTDGSSEVETADGALLGTPEYMSPEQFKGAAHADERTDVWAMGAILYRALTGINAFAGPTIAATLLMVSSEEPTPVREHNPAVPAELAAIIAKCLDKTAERRFPSAVALSEALRPFDDDAVLPSTDGDEPVPAGRSDDALTRLKTTKHSALEGRRPSRLDRRALAVLGAVLLAGGAASWYALRPDPPAPDATPPTGTLTAKTTTPPTDDDSADDDTAGDKLALAAPTTALGSGETGVQNTGPAEGTTSEPAPESSSTWGGDTPIVVEDDGDGGASSTGDPDADDADDGGTTATPNGRPRPETNAHGGPPTGTPTEPPKDPAGASRFGRYLVVDKPGPSSDHTDARRYCEKLAAASHLGISTWRLAGLTVADSLIGSKKVKRGTYWTAARWQGRARTIKLPSGDKKSHDAKRSRARPLCVAKWP
jgi:serine/threonine-protein kinase